MFFDDSRNPDQFERCQKGCDGNHDIQYQGGIRKYPLIRFDNIESCITIVIGLVKNIITRTGAKINSY